MKVPFIFDLTMIYGAATLKNVRGEEDASAFQLMTRVFEECHPLFVTPGLLKEYIRRLSDLKDRRDAITDKPLRLLLQGFTFEGKYDIRDETALHNLPEEGQFHSKDNPIVRLAAEVDAGILLATEDEKLKEQLNITGVSSKYNFTVLNPKEALDQLGKPP